MQELNPEALEQEALLLESVDDFKVDYEKYIQLSKKDLMAFCRIVEPLTKSSVDDYGKCVFVKCVDNDNVQLLYKNSPYFVAGTLPNKSGRQVKEFAILVSVLKKLITNAFESLILVEDNGEINIALCESLLYLDTRPLLASQYDFTAHETPSHIDKECAIFTFKKIGASLSLTDRPSEKTIVIKDGQAHFNTGIFCSRSRSPFSGEENFVLYKQVSDTITALSEISKTGINYAIEGNQLFLACDSNYYVECQIGDGEKVAEFLSPAAKSILSFDANIEIINDNLLRLVTVVQSMDYLSDIVNLTFEKDKMIVTISSVNQAKQSNYEFRFTSGAPEEPGSMRITVEVLKMFLQIVGKEVVYSFNKDGLGIKNEGGVYLIRRT